MLGATCFLMRCTACLSWTQVCDCTAYHGLYCGQYDGQYFCVIFCFVGWGCVCDCWSWVKLIMTVCRQMWMPGAALKTFDWSKDHCDSSAGC